MKVLRDTLLMSMGMRVVLISGGARGGGVFGRGEGQLGRGGKCGGTRPSSAGCVVVVVVTVVGCV